jgi:acylphosphatase
MSGLNVVRVRLVITGRVQGVWYRDSCKKRARVESVGGWVRNRIDGAVEAEFEGPEPAVARMIAWCREGPRRARVENVAVEELKPTGERVFRVR